jgi:uncharacterized paraquat-inducible protein A
MSRRWKINSSRYAYQVLVMISVLTIVVPIALYIGFMLLGQFGINGIALKSAIRISIAIGLALLALFVLLLIIEGVQDHFQNVRYTGNKSQRLRLANGYYECQYCGYQKVRASDRRCPVCSKDLQ